MFETLLESEDDFAEFEMDGKDLGLDYNTVVINAKYCGEHFVWFVWSVDGRILKLQEAEEIEAAIERDSCNTDLIKDIFDDTNVDYSERDFGEDWSAYAPRVL